MRIVNPRHRALLAVSLSWKSSLLQRSSRFFATSNNNMEAPSAYQDATSKHYTFNGTSQKDNKSSVTVVFDTSGHTIATDLPRFMGGHDTAPQPVEHLLAAWAGCTQATALFVGRQLASSKKNSQPPTRPRLERLEFVNITATRDERGALVLPIDKDPPVPSRIHTLTGRIVVWPSMGDDLQVLREQTELRCPVANMLIASGCQMNVQWVNGGEEEEEEEEKP